MIASNLLQRIYLLGGVIFLYFTSCSNLDDTPTPVMTRYNLPSQVLDDVFTPDIPEEIRNVDNFLDRMVGLGMVIHQGDDPPEIYALNGFTMEGLKFVVDSDCIYDGRNSSNVGSVYGRYEEIIKISSEQNSLFAEVNYSSLEGAGFPDFPDGLDTGSGRGYVSGNGNNFTIFYRVENGLYGNVNYQAIWMISGTVSNSPNARELNNVTKCMIMLGKGTDPEDRVANRGTVRIFRDADPDWIQPEVLISELNPIEGPYSTVVTIEGSGFGSLDDKVEVRFNGIVAEVLKASSTQLTVTVPKGAGSGPVLVQVNEMIGEGPDFNYIPVYTVSTLAGMGEPGGLDGSAEIAMFNNPFGVAVDAGATVYVADTENNRIRYISPEGVVSSPRYQEDPDGSIFFRPNGVAVDIQGNIYLADTGNARIAKISPSGEVSIVGRLDNPSGIAIDNLSNAYISSIDYNFIIVLSPEGSFSDLAPRYPFNNPSGIAVDPSGQVYVADRGNHRILKITPEGEVTILAGSEAGFQDGTGTSASFLLPNGLAVDSLGNIYVADMGNHRIRKISPEGEVTTLAGTGESGFLNGIGSEAMFNNPTGIAIDEQGIIYVADSQNHRIRKMVLE